MSYRGNGSNFHGSTWEDDVGAYEHRQRREDQLQIIRAFLDKEQLGDLMPTAHILTCQFVKLQPGWRVGHEELMARAEQYVESEECRTFSQLIGYHL